MTTLYFSSTGNCLYVAKKLGGKNLPIPSCIKNGIYEVKDDIVGIIFPVYGLLIPPFIEEYIKKISVECDYFFAVATYGFFPGGITSLLREIRTSNGHRFDYINRLKMAENCITFSDMKSQTGDSEKERLSIQRICEDIREKRKYIRPDTCIHRFLSRSHMKKYEFETGTGITKDLTINKSCTGCGICEKICPMSNIHIDKGRPRFDGTCVSCGSCIQNCPSNAIHHNGEKSSARYRHPQITLDELLP